MDDHSDLLSQSLGNNLLYIEREKYSPALKLNLTQVEQLTKFSLLLD